MRAVALMLAGLAVAGCGADDESPQGPDGPAPVTRLEVVVRPEGEDGPRRTFTLACPEDPRCARLDAAALEPVRPDVACTEIYGGPATASVTGRIEGRPVRATFSRNNGCEIARWDELEWLLGPGGGPSGP